MRARPRFLRIRAGAAASAAALLAACAGGPRPPAPAPAPAPGRTEPRPPDAPAPAVEVPVVRGPSVAARYSSGTYRYAVVTTAAVDLAAPGAVPESDSLVTRAYVTYVLGGGGAGQSVGGAVDSVFVSSRRSQAASQAVTVALPFGGTLTPSGVRLAGDSASGPVAPLACARTGSDALLGVARDLLVALPPTLAEGAAWRDSTSATSCRGNVPLTTSTVHEYRVARVVADSATGARTATVERTSRATIAGQGSGGSAGTTVVGTGSGQARLTFDLAAGRYEGGELTSAADLTVTTAAGVQTLRQRGATSVTRVP